MVGRYGFQHKGPTNAGAVVIRIGFGDRSYYNQNRLAAGGVFPRTERCFRRTHGRAPSQMP